MDNKQIIDKIQKYSVNSYYTENNNKIAIKLYSNIGIWIYLIIYKADNKIQNLCEYKTTGKIAWNVIELKEFYKTFVRKRFEFIKLGDKKPKELKNIKADYSVKFMDHKTQIFVKENDLFICFPKYSYNIYHAVYFKLQNFKQLYFAVKNIDEKPEMILKIYLAKKLYEIDKQRNNNLDIADYIYNAELLEMFGELVKKYKI